MIGEFLVSHPNVEVICLGVAVFFLVVWFIVRRSKDSQYHHQQIPQPNFNAGGQKRIILDVNVNFRLGKEAKGLFKNFDFEGMGSMFSSGNGGEL